MSTEEPQRATPAADVDAPMQESPTTPAPAPTRTRRPRLNLEALGIGGGGERKHGRSMLGVFVNTLNKAKAEDKERSASEAAKKRQMIEQRLQIKLKKETDHVRQIEEAKRDKIATNRKEEDLQLKDSMNKFRRAYLPSLSNFLLTSDVIPAADENMDDDLKPSMLLPPRSHPPPLYYLPSILTPEQESFLAKRKQPAIEAAEKEWEQFKLERNAAIEEISATRRKVAAVLKTEAKSDEKENGDVDRPPASAVDEAPADEKQDSSESPTKEADMDVDDSTRENGSRESQPESEKEKEGRTQPTGEDDAVEY